MNERDVLRFDQFAWPEKAERTPEGFLRVDAPLTRFGVLVYQNPDGSTTRALRHPDDWGTPDVLARFRSLPLTNDHPPPRPRDGDRVVDSENAKTLTVGWTGEQVRIDADVIRAPLTVVDAAMVRAIDRGRRGTSTGVHVRERDEIGIYDGPGLRGAYDVRQFNPRPNHIAFVDSPRAGTTIRLDSDGHQILDGSEETMNEKKLATVRLDGIDYEAAPEIVNAWNRTKEEAAELKTRLDAVEKKAKDGEDKLRAERDALKERLDKAEKRDIRAEVRQRVSLETSARKILPEAEHAKLDAMNDAEIKRTVVAAKWPDLKLDDKSAAYIETRFEIALEESARTDADETSRQDAIGRQREKSAPRHDGGDADAAIRAQEERIAHQWDPAWKPAA